MTFFVKIWGGCFERKGYFYSGAKDAFLKIIVIWFFCQKMGGGALYCKLRYWRHFWKLWILTFIFWFCTYIFCTKSKKNIDWKKLDFPILLYFFRFLKTLESIFQKFTNNQVHLCNATCVYFEKLFPSLNTESQKGIEFCKVSGNQMFLYDM